MQAMGHKRKEHATDKKTDRRGVQQSRQLMRVFHQHMQKLAGAPVPLLPPPPPAPPPPPPPHARSAAHRAAAQGTTPDTQCNRAGYHDRTR